MRVIITALILLTMLGVYLGESYYKTNSDKPPTAETNPSPSTVDQLKAVADLTPPVQQKNQPAEVNSNLDEIKAEVISSPWEYDHNIAQANHLSEAIENSVALKVDYEKLLALQKGNVISMYIPQEDVNLDLTITGISELPLGEQMYSLKGVFEQLGRDSFLKVVVYPNGLTGSLRTTDEEYQLDSVNGVIQISPKSNIEHTFNIVDNDHVHDADATHTFQSH